MPKIILLAEPEQAVRESICTLLGDEGYKCVCASDGENAIAALNVFRFDLVITEVQLPCLPGITIVEKAVYAPSHPPVVLITTYPNIDTAYEAMKLGASSFHLKPLDFSSFVRSINTLLTRQRVSA